MEQHEPAENTAARTAREGRRALRSSAPRRAAVPLLLAKDLRCARARVGGRGIQRGRGKEREDKSKAQPEAERPSESMFIQEKIRATGNTADECAFLLSTGVSHFPLAHSFPHTKLRCPCGGKVRLPPFHRRGLREHRPPPDRHCQGLSLSLSLSLS
eukprot:COSAG03_NODE_4896_length_1402_cov_1.516500_2_plen_156_part_01